MFERYITDALTTHFGHILETVDSDKMKMSAWKGELELHDVTLQRHALDNVLKQQCPLEIAHGSVGTFQVKIPWSLLSAQFLSWQNDTSANKEQPNLLESSVCSIILSDVNILVTPRRKDDTEEGEHKEQQPEDEHDENSELKQRAEKEKEVQALLDAYLLKRVTESSVSSARWTWLQDWISNLLSTLSVTIRNIHIRYEDPGTSLGFQWTVGNQSSERGNSLPNNSAFFCKHRQYRPAFAVGITLKEFSIQSVSEAAVKNAQAGFSTDTIAGSMDEDEEIAGTVRTDDDTTTISSGVTSSKHNGTVASASDGPKAPPGIDTPSPVFIHRYKLAAAEHLAVYWDSDSPLICVRATQPHPKDLSSQPDQKRNVTIFQQCFAMLNDGKDAQLPSEPFPVGHPLPHRYKHSYLLDPISPSVHLTLVSKAPEVTSLTVGEPRKEPKDTKGLPSSRQSISVRNQVHSPIPPSSIQINLPPCKFTLAKNFLEDTVYLRKSLSIWTDAARTLLSEETLRRLANLRPVLSPLEDPSSWWLYAFEATKALIRVDQESRDGKLQQSYFSRSKNVSGATNDQTTQPRPLTRRKGWYGLVQAVSSRRKYVELYQTLVKASDAQDRDAEESTHRALLSMEDELFPDEIVSFRIHAYEALIAQQQKTSSEAGTLTAETVDEPLQQQDSKLVKGETDEQILSVHHRRWMMNEMKLALDRERANKETQFGEDEYRASTRDLTAASPILDNEQNMIMWTSSLVCRELAIQVNDQGSDRGSSGKHKHFIPIVRLSTAILQDQSWYRDGSWNSNCSLAALDVKDLISSKDREYASKHFQTLLGRKTGHDTVKSEEFIIINGIRYHKSISVTVNKVLHWTDEHALVDTETGRGSTTTTQVRILPMEVVYSTIPVEAVTRVFSTVRTPEIVDDYHKVLAAANSWREEQKRKLMDALAHKNKKIILDIDVNAPELLIPEDIFRSDSPMLTIDLGRIQAYNDDDALNGDTPDNFDDQLRLIVSNMQARTTSVETYFSASNFNGPPPQQVIEAFSIDFVVSTKFTTNDSERSEEASKIHVLGTLPRLAFNFTSSAIFLVSRLQQRWKRRKREMEIHNLMSQPLGPSSSTYQAYAPHPPVLHVKQKRINGRRENIRKKQDSQSTLRAFRFDFSAPFITLKLENDVSSGGTDLGLPSSAPLFDMAIGGISGSLVQNIAHCGDAATRFSASLQSLGVIDLFQSAGSDFVLFMSSVPQVALIDKINAGSTFSWDGVHDDSGIRQNLEDRQALVTIEYLNESKTALDDNGQRVPIICPKEVSIWFHELYIEWNPETLAAIQKAIRTPAERDNAKYFDKKPSPVSSVEDDIYSSSSEDEFYDAVEELRAEGSICARSLSEISESSENPVLLESSLQLPNAGSFFGEGINSPGRFSFSSAPGSPFTSGLSHFESATLLPIPLTDENEQRTDAQPMKLVFELSKLRVSFNKETRHRKLVVAQMDKTFISYATKPEGGSNIAMKIGNLVFVDPSHERKETLYGHILGLKNDTSDNVRGGPSSLLEMAIVLNPKAREYSSLLDGDRNDTVTIDRNKGVICGSDCSLTAILSPMRFVLIEQLWLEIIDYFFQGVIGAEVLGSSKADATSNANQLSNVRKRLQDPEFLPGSDANGISFTLFDVTLESPVILLPVTYASPEFLRLELAKVSISNQYVGLVISDGKDAGSSKRMQWFNNCTISLDELRLFSWSGLELGKEPVLGKVLIRWPTGPLAELIIPKWRVKVSFDSLDISLRRIDYALLQNIISYNIGEQSRYMEEWTVLQNLSTDVFNSYMKKIIVHYGYDKKDVAPSTYHMAIYVPSLKFNLIGGERTSCSPVAIARCFDLKFDMEKGSDLLVKQTVVCDIDLVTPVGVESQYEKLLSMSKYAADFEEEDTTGTMDKPGLTYTSSCLPDNNIVKTLEIRDACIYMIVPKWRRFASFFQSLSPPVLLNEHDIGSSIQVGDRWYRIGDSGPSPLAAPNASRLGTPNSRRRITWIDVGSAANFYSPQTRNSSMLSIGPQSDNTTSQWRVVLTWPRIVLSSVATEVPQTRVVLRMHHLDFLQTNQGSSCSMKKSIFLHDVEVYTSKGSGISKASMENGENSLIHPWSAALSVSSCNGESIGDCEKHSYTLTSNVLRARAAYSDMTITIDVMLSVLHSAREETRNVSEDTSLDQVFTAGSYDSLDASSITINKRDSIDDDHVFCRAPESVVYDIQCDGFQLQISDDSGRHFAGPQDLVSVSLGTILFSRQESVNGATSAKLSLRSLDLIDCLQPEISQFRIAASSTNTSHDLTKDIAQTSMDWEQFGSRDTESGLYRRPDDFVARVSIASSDCYIHLWSKEQESLVPGLIEFETKLSGENHQEIDIRFRSFTVQWNPSTVIAVQRFLGRLKKESKAIAVQFDDILGASGKVSMLSGKDYVDSQDRTVTMNVQIDELTVCLNKEHQYRRLLELRFSECKVQLNTSSNGTMIDCSLTDFSATDKDRYTFGTAEEKSVTDDIRSVVSVLKAGSASSTERFLRIVYKKFSEQTSSFARAEVPSWILSHSASEGGIDDILIVNIASIRIIYLKQRTDEILDYLSNGLPGKGMGATSRAAKGFISRRIQSKSFLQLQVNSPQVYIPQHETETRGLSLRLGDVSVRSWFEEESVEGSLSQKEWWRVLSLKLTGFRSGVTRAGASSEKLSSTTVPVDLDIVLRKATVKGRTMFVKGTLSCFAVTLNYSDYCLLGAVFRDNVGRAVDTEKWDNVEKAYWKEYAEITRGDVTDDSLVSGVTKQNRVYYSSNARFVRYGKGGKKGTKNVLLTNSDEISGKVDHEKTNQDTFDLRFDLDGLALKLRRDDVVDGIMPGDALALSFHYDVMLLRVNKVDIMATSSAAGDLSFNLSLYRVGLFDLGDDGRLIRERYFFSLPIQDTSGSRSKRKPPRAPCPFKVLVEGYDTLAETEGANGFALSNQDAPNYSKGPQFVVSVDTCPASSTTGFGSLSESGLPPDAQVTVARVVINHLSVNALVRPFKEIVAFLTCEWSMESEESRPHLRRMEQSNKVHPTANDGASTKGKGFELKLVSHYPRVFFVADESDPHSRALVLRGLAVINASDVKRIEAVGTRKSDSIDSQHVTSVDAQLHGLETYINPDVDAVLRFSQRHVEMIGGWIDTDIPLMDEMGSLENGDALGVALIQPVTTGIEFTQTVRDLFPTRRSLVVNIEPVSTMLSFEDLQLVERVLNRWSKKGKKSAGPFRNDNITMDIPSTEQYEILFKDTRLGLGLRTEGEKILVSSVQNNTFSREIKCGDALVAVDENQVAKKSLEQVVKMLTKAKRPVSIKFERKSQTEHLKMHTLKDAISPDVAPSVLSTSADSKPNVETAESFSCPVYSLSFYLGAPLGLEFEESPCGKFPVVSKVLPSVDEAVVVPNAIGIIENEQIEIIEPAFDPATTRIPKVGAVVVAIDEIPVEEIGVKAAWELLLRTQKARDASEQAPNDLSPRVATFRLSFQEIDSAVWGKVETADVSIAGVALSFIDDFNGRDMPLFRGKLNTMELHAARGIGVESHIIDRTVPMLLSPLDMDCLEKSVTLDSRTVQEIHTESIVSLTAIGRFSVDYFHPRVAFWEPLLEPSQLFFLLEKQGGSIESQRPAQIALEMSDRLPGTHSVRTNLAQSIYFKESSMVSVNITDAAAEVLVQGIRRWKMWRQDISSKMIEMGEGCDSPDFTPKSPEDDSIVLSGDEPPEEIQRAAAQQAAQAALVFAQKRGAETSKSSPSSKPFIFRNRTGMSVAFVQQGKGLRDQAFPSKRKLESSSTLETETAIGEYRGLERYERQAITELADQEDAKFDIDLIETHSNDGSIMGRSVRHFNNKVRSYEGRYPDLTVAIQAVAGVSIEPLADLQVFKVGSSIRYLTVKKEISTGFAIHSIRVVWNVEIEDNRRILTLSTAVRLISSGFGIPIEVGVRKGTARNGKEDFRSLSLSSIGFEVEVGSSKASQSSADSTVTSIGLVSSKTPLYMPLWLALKLEPINVCIRPASIFLSDFEWSHDAVLQFGPVDQAESQTDASFMARWTWEETFQELSFVRCDPQNFTSSSVWFSVFGSTSLGSYGNTLKQGKEEKKKSSVKRRDESDLFDVLSLTLDSCLTLRNMLPLDIAWEVSCSSKRDTNHRVLPSCSEVSSPRGTEFLKTKLLHSGELTEIVEYCHNSFNLQARFQMAGGNAWSTWASLRLDDLRNFDDEIDSNDPSEVVDALFPSSCQVNVEIQDGPLGVPTIFGARILPKMTTDDPFQGQVYGLEIIVYAELWIRNITSLPLNFGCPGHQLQNALPNLKKQGTSFDESVAKFTAESALMEIANLLEVGDKGTGLNQSIARKMAESGTIESLPNQTANSLVEEVFEYVEINSSMVRRRWWASESFDSYRQNITNVTDGNATWKWIDESWAIDSSGEAKPLVDGWESCRNLLTGNSSFTGTRKFDPSHGFRRRRYFRSRTGEAYRNRMQKDLSIKIHAFHHPINDSFSRNQTRLRKKGKMLRSFDSTKDEKECDAQTKISVKCGDGQWSTPSVIPDNGTSYGVIQAMASRWPQLTMTKKNYSSQNLMIKKKGKPSEDTEQCVFKEACLEPRMYELCYVVSDVPGDWGDFSRVMEVSPRFVLRNDSKKYCLQIKQSGAPDSTRLDLMPSQASPFYWADFRLPRLVSVKPVKISPDDGVTYKWSGGFDLCSLGMTPVRVRSKTLTATDGIMSIRSLVEVRSGTGGMGINVSLREENVNGEGSLFRIENLTPFPIWLEQDGILANPTSKVHQASQRIWEDDSPLIDGDLVGPNAKMTFALDIPYRQGKYASRKEATLSELLQVRVALAPLSSRAGVEMVKVIGLTIVGETVRMNPSRLPLDLTQESWQRIRPMRVLGVVASDGPTRVLRFSLMAYTQEEIGLSSSFGESPYISNQSQHADRIVSSDNHDYTSDINQAASNAIELSKSESIPNEIDAKRKALFTKPSASFEENSLGYYMDTIFSVRAEFTGFIFSLIDSAPSEIAVASCRNVNALTRWNALRTTDASVLVSVGWLQIDNHVPSAPFKVAVRPDTSRNKTVPGYLNEGDALTGPSPVLVIALAFAPRHKSKIMVMRSATIAPQELVIAVDLAFLVRLQRFFYGLQEHFSKKTPSDPHRSMQSEVGSLSGDIKKQIPFPDFESAEKQLKIIASFRENQKLYFQGLTILPTNIKLSVAPARALTPEQASLEGKETAAIHQAVRKGDVLVGNGSGPLGVRVGRKNKTPLAVVRGVFKSIVVDAILRLDGASLNFPGVFLRNHIATGSQLSTLLMAHYLSSLKSNVPALLGSLSAIGNPLGLIRGIGDGMADFVTEPVKGLKRSLKELDPGYAVDGVARGTESLARHTVGGLADSASLLLETFSKYMAVVTLDRKYAQKRDMRRSLRNRSESRVTLAGGVESGFSKLIQGFREGVTGVVRAPIRGAEKRGFEGFAKGLGKGLLGLLVKPIVGITDAATDVMIGVKSTVEYKEEQQQSLALLKNQLRPRRPMYGRDKVLRPYRLEDAAAATLMLRTRCAGENYLSHMDMNDRVALLSVKRLVILGSRGEEQLALKYNHVARLEMRRIKEEDGSDGWAIVVILNTPRRNGSEVEVITCHSEQEALDLCSQIQRGVELESSDAMVQT